MTRSDDTSDWFDLQPLSSPLPSLTGASRLSSSRISARPAVGADRPDDPLGALPGVRGPSIQPPARGDGLLARRADAGIQFVRAVARLALRACAGVMALGPGVTVRADLTQRDAILDHVSAVGHL